MAKFFMYENDEDVVKMVDSIAEEMDLTNYIDFQVLGTDKGKDVVKVVKANEFAEVVSDRSDLVFVVVHHEAFSLVSKEDQMMWLRLEMDKVAYDSEKDKVIIGTPCITIPIGIAEKYGDEAIRAAKLAVYTISQLKDAKKKKKKGEE